MTSLTLTLFFSTNAFSQSSAPKSYYKDPAVAEFQINPNVKNFEAIDPDFRVYALSEILAEKNSPTNSGPLFHKYFPSLSPDEKQIVYALAFSSALATDDIKTATELFEEGTNLTASVATNYLCRDLENKMNMTYTHEDDSFEAKSVSSNAIITFIAKTPGLANASCDMMAGDNDRVVSMPIYQIVATLSPALYQKLYQQTKNILTPSQAILREYASCTAPQLSWIIFNAMKNINGAPAGNSVLVNARDESCIVDGLIKVKKIGYEFAASLATSGYSEKTFSFLKLEQLVAYLKGNPQRGLALPQQTAIASVQQNRNLHPIFVQSKSMTTPAATQTSKPQPNNGPFDLTNPFTEGLSKKLKNFFNM